MKYQNAAELPGKPLWGGGESVLALPHGTEHNGDSTLQEHSLLRLYPARRRCENMDKTRKSSCLNARGIPPAAWQVLFGDRSFLYEAASR